MLPRFDYIYKITSKCFFESHIRTQLVADEWKEGVCQHSIVLSSCTSRHFGHRVGA